jgi:hypothetical protein
MNSPMPFDSNQAIQRWREALAQSPAFRSENLDELEAHLRDSIAKLEGGGLSAEEAFLVASRRIGRDGALAVEFGKVNGHAVWLDRLLWMLIGIQAWGLVSNLIGSLTRTAISLGWSSAHYDYKQSGLALPVTLFSLVQVAVLAASIAFCGWLIVRKGPQIGAWLAPWLGRRSTLVATGAGLCLLSVVAGAISFFSHTVLARHLGPETYGATIMYFSYSQLVVGPIQIVGLVAITLILARKRLCLTRA